MTEEVLALVPAWGPLLLGVATLLSCLALPIPASLLMLAAGAFAAGGDLSIWTCGGAALVGALIGDQVGYLVGRTSARVLRRARRRAKLARMLARAEALIQARGGLGVFLSRWLASPLGPYVNVLAGASGMAYPLFVLSAAAGEVLWVSIYIGIGYVFAGRVESLADLAGNVSGALTAGAVTLVLGGLLLRAARRSGALGSTRDAGGADGGNVPAPGQEG